MFQMTASRLKEHYASSGLLRGRARPYYNGMKLEPLGESAFTLRELGAWDPTLLSEAVGAGVVPGLVESVCAYDTVAVYVDPDLFNPDALLRRLEQAEPGRQRSNARRHIVPVCYRFGEDLTEAASRLGLTPEEVVELHCSTDYRCYAVGFSPGFPYLGYLPTQLQGVDRLPSPRPRVPAGSVAITGSQTGIYPQETPGGWALIGRTPLQLVDLREGFFAIRAGDTVRFRSIPPEEFDRLKGGRL
jgi:inhibitor of KinA